MLQVRYVGLKDKEIDKRGKTGLVWVGKGSVHPVPEKVWDDYMSKHPDVWELVLEGGGLSEAVMKPAEVVPEQPAEPKLVTDMDDAELRAFAAANTLKIDGRKKGESLRAAVLDAMSA